MCGAWLSPCSPGPAGQSGSSRLRPGTVPGTVGAMASAPDTIAAALHAGGVSVLVPVPGESLPGVLARLTSCHAHVFVVDQSSGEDRVVLGLSETGAACVADHLAQVASG